MDYQEILRLSSDFQNSQRSIAAWILAALRDCRFSSVQEAQMVAAEKLEKPNSRPFRRREGTLREAYLGEECSRCPPCPTSRPCGPRNCG